MMDYRSLAYPLLHSAAVRSGVSPDVAFNAAVSSRAARDVRRLAAKMVQEKYPWWTLQVIRNVTHCPVSVIADVTGRSDNDLPPFFDVDPCLIDMKSIIRAVADVACVRVDEVMTARSPRTAMLRFIAMHIIRRRRPEASMNMIARVFRRDRTAIIYGLRRVAETYPEVASS